MFVFSILLVRYELWSFPDRKMNEEEKKIAKKSIDNSFIPMDRILLMLNDLKDSLDPLEVNIIKDINYCIFIIVNNRMYSPEYDFEDVDNISNDDALSEEELGRKRTVKLTKQRVI